MASGSQVLFLDTGEYAEYYSFNKTWYMINQSSGVDINAIKKELGLDDLDGDLISVKI